MAAYLYECILFGFLKRSSAHSTPTFTAMVEPNSMPGNATFVAGFVQSNVGDTSPNTSVISHSSSQASSTNPRRQKPRCLLREPRQTMERPALRIRAFYVRKQDTGLPWSARTSILLSKITGPEESDRHDLGSADPVSRSRASSPTASSATRSLRVLRRL